MYVLISFLLMILLSLVFWLLCYLGLGSDEKNIKSIYSYPDSIIEEVKKNPELKAKMPKEKPWYLTFISNLIVFSIIIFLLGLINKEESFLKNFISALIIGEGLNLFDFLIMDLCWWRNSKRIRFSMISDQILYKDPKKHFYAFLRGIVCFFLVSLIVGLLLWLI